MDGSNVTLSVQELDEIAMLVIAIPGINVTKYLSGSFLISRKKALLINFGYAVAGLVVLLYDHLLLFGEEVRLFHIPLETLLNLDYRSRSSGVRDRTG